MSGGGGTAAPEDEVAKLQRYIDDREQELRGVRDQVAELVAAQRERRVIDPFEDAAEMKSELQRLYKEKASAEQLLHDYNQRLLLLQQQRGDAGGCAVRITGSLGMCRVTDWQGSFCARVFHDEAVQRKIGVSFIVHEHC
jgi:hypothetical protein